MPLPPFSPFCLDCEPIFMKEEIYLSHHRIRAMVPSRNRLIAFVPKCLHCCFWTSEQSNGEEGPGEHSPSTVLLGLSDTEIHKEYFDRGSPLGQSQFIVLHKITASSSYLATRMAGLALWSSLAPKLLPSSRVHCVPDHVSG